MSATTVEEMRQHIEKLSRKHDIVVGRVRRPAEAWSVREFEEICIPEIKSATSYATALHELGHILGRHQLSRKTMVRERWAWQWARKNALTWTPIMERDRCESLEFAARSRGVGV